jgi:hypothetical protein
MHPDTSPGKSRGIKFHITTILLLLLLVALYSFGNDFPQRKSTFGLSVNCSPDSGGLGWGALPVRLELFEANLQNQVKVDVTWKTAEQWTNIHYEIERGEDAYHFKTVGIVTPPDNLPTTRSYHFLDDIHTILRTNVLFYRLKQVNKDNKVSYSYIIAVRIRNGDEKDIVKTWPNPFTEGLQVNFYAEEKSVITTRVLMMDGRLMLQEKFYAEKGNNVFNISNAGKLSMGTYIVQVWKNNNLVTTERLIKGL